jgi:hypothetical protein
MKSPPSQPTTALALALAGLSLFPILTLALAAADECQPWTWTWNLPRAAAATPAPARADPLPPREVTQYARKGVEPQPGELNCRSWGQTYDNVGYWSCNQLAQEFAITINKFWELNQELAPDCEGIAPNTEYCVSGCKLVVLFFSPCTRSVIAGSPSLEVKIRTLISPGLSTVIEPVRATDGLCGPKHNNATCIGTAFGQCCNAETWKCGRTECASPPPRGLYS